MRARDPLRVLAVCRDRRLRAVLNHRPRLASSNGHFTVLIDLAGDDVVVHDPLVGPNTRIHQDDLLELWQPSGGKSEITGNVLVVVAQDRQPSKPCPRCGTTIPQSIPCPGCGQPIPLLPSEVIGCMNAACPERAWDVLFCPQCDAATSASAGKDSRGPRAATTTRPGESPGAIDDDLLQVQMLSQKIDEFVALLLSVNHGRPVPSAADLFPVIRQLQTEMLELQKQRVIEQRAAAAATSPAAPARPAAPPEPVAEAPTPAPPRPPVDWNELARKLVDEIGRRPA